MKNRSIQYFLLAWASVLAFAGGVTALPSITEVVPASQNMSMPDEDGDYPAYIVISYPEIFIFDEGWYLTSNPQNPVMWQIPPGSFVAKDNDLIVFASGKNRTTLGEKLHTNFAYPCEVPFCGLYRDRERISEFSLQGSCFPCEGQQLIFQETPVRWMVPKEGMGHEWVQLDYKDSEWNRGILGIGYDAPESLCSDMIVYTTMDEERIQNVAGAGLIALDTSESPIVHNGFISGKPGIVAAQVLEGLEFPLDSRSVVRIPHHAELNPQQMGFTVSVWVNPREEKAREVLVAKGGSSQKDPGWMIARDDTGTFFQLAYSFDTYRLKFPDIPARQWSHLCVVLDPGRPEMRSYFNGELIDTVPVETLSAPLGERDLILGNLQPQADLPYNGILDEFAIWIRPLSRPEVLEVYKNGAEGQSIQTNCGGFSVSLYDDLIGTDVEVPMKGVNSSILIRVPFSIQDPSMVQKLTLGMHYDDGFVMYLNGQEVLRRNAPSVPVLPMNASSVMDRPDLDALIPEIFNLTSSAGLLRVGTNILAIHGLNSRPDADRFIIYPKLCLEQREPVNNCTRTTNGQDFWITFPENSKEDDTNPLEISVLICGVPSVSGNVEVPLMGFSQNFTIGADGTAKVVLPAEYALDGEDSIEKKGVHVTATRDVAVYGLTHIDYSTDTFLGIPTDLLGNEYITVGYQNIWSELEILNGSQFAIVAPYDQTVIEIRPSTKTATRPSGGPYTIVLNRGETHQLRSVEDPPSDLTGTIIKSNRPVAVFGGHRCANIRGKQYFCDQIVEQLLPVPAWGTRYNTVPLATRSKDTIRVVASRDGTPVMVNGVMVAMLGRGKHHDFVTDQPSRIVSEFPIMVAQFSNSSDFDMVEDSDPFMTMAQPEESYMHLHRFYAPPTPGFDKNYVNIIVPTGSAPSVQLDGTAITLIPGAVGIPFPVGGLEGWQVPVSSASVGHQVGGLKTGIGLITYGFASYDFDSYGTTGAMQFNDHQPPIVACPEKVTIFATLQDPESQKCVGIVPDIAAQTDIYENCSPLERVVVMQDPPPGTLLARANTRSRSRPWTA
jgi:hypothetical protein